MGDGADDSPDLLSLWWETQARTGLVRHDPHLLVLHPVEAVCGEYAWGTVFYSKAREDYKARVGSLSREATTFDLDLMSKLQLARAGGLLVAANPNSLVPGHLVLYPEQKRARLSLSDVQDVGRLARRNSGFTFIHNMERAAASIVDWAHYQAYPWNFPLAREQTELLLESDACKLSRLPETYPAYALSLESESDELLAAWLFGMLKAFACEREEEATRQSVPCNIVWRGNRAWLFPRSSSQSKLAATYVGALELGGLFCLPSADSLRLYLPDALRAEMRQASIADEPQGREWCERIARETLRSLSAAPGSQHERAH